MGRPAKTLEQLVRAGTFRARRDSHRELLAGPDAPWPGFAVLQQRFRLATSEPGRREVALEFERAVQLTHAAQLGQTANGRDNGASEAAELAAELGLLGRPGSTAALHKFFPAYLAHTKGPLRGQPFKLAPWQRTFLAGFNQRDRQGRRLYRRGLLGVPRGCGKTPLAAGLALYDLVTRHDRPEVYFAAGSKEQAGIAHSFARAFVEDGPLGRWVDGRNVLRCSATGGELRVVSSDGRLQHGRAPSAALIDELWAFETDREEQTYIALSTALMKRQDSFLLAITTAGFNLDSLLGRIYNGALAWEIETSANGFLTVAKDPENGQLMHWYAAPEDADIENPAVWRGANPARWIDLDELKRQLNDPGLNEHEFRRLHLNQWTKSVRSWLPGNTWADLHSDEKIPAGADICIGVDVGLHHDTTAVAWAYRNPDGRILLRVRVWAARDDAKAHVHVPGGKVLLEEVEQFILQLSERFNVREVAYDPRFFDRSAELLEKAGLTLVEFLQASAPMGDALQVFYQLAREGRLAHNGDPVFAAHVDATAARMTDRGWKISKVQSKQRIDALVAAVLATARARHPKPAGPKIFWMEM